MTSNLLKPFGPNIWTVDGPTVTVIGFHYPTRMAIIRLADGALFIWSPVAHTEDLGRELSAIGIVRFIIAPNTLHDLFLSQWQRVYPEAKLHVPSDLSQRHNGLTVHADLQDAAPNEWAGQVEQVIVCGNRIATEVVFFHVASRTVLFTDLIQNFPSGWFTGWRAIIATLDGLTSSEPTVPQKFRVAFSDRKAARASLARICSWPADKVLMAHGAPVLRDGSGFIARAFAWLMN